MIGLGVVEMTSLLSLDNKMAKMDTLGAVRTELKGKLLTEKNEERKEKLQEQLDKTEQNISETAKEANDKIEADRGKIYAERAEMRQEMENRIETVRENNRAETVEGTEPTQPVVSGETTVGGESAEYAGAVYHAVMVEISVAGRNAAVSAPKPVSSITSPRTVQSGEILNVTA